MDFYKKLLLFKSINKLSYKEIGEPIQMDQAAIRMAVNRKSLRPSDEKVLTDFFDLENSGDNDSISLDKRKIEKLATESVSNWNELMQVDSFKSRFYLELTKTLNMDIDEIFSKVLKGK
ncbi:hypothetical protein [Aquimarina algiphila]|uniref:Uncharacterized protein n=1 Tax=Aquimarina algiphila TaxID=2047982 RepID=A0A554VF95_9FLAO|nr:hypothetical protein [Aquimarina algiphila]TSE05829.1 hypothetical protein FOF46_21570 [Aquimarina algiphila]